MKSRKSQYSLIEMPLVLLLLGFFLTLSYQAVHNFEGIGVQNFQVGSSLSTIINNKNNLKVILTENLSQTSLTENWTNITNYLSSLYSNYTLTVSNRTITKYVINCSNNVRGVYSSKIVSIYNNSLYSFRILNLEVCY